MTRTFRTLSPAVWPSKFNFAARCCAAALVAASPLAHAGELPLWEAGIGATALRLPDYRGSDESRTYVFPIPYLVYRGDVLKADRGGARGVLFENDRLDVDVSVDGTVPTTSRNRARQGMPTRKATLEFGPNLNLTVFRSADRRMKLTLRMPLRTGVTVEGHPKDVGVVASPNLNLDLFDLGRASDGRGWNVGLKTGPIFATQRQYDYFYGVRPEYARPDRPAYRPDGGYGGVQFLAALSRRYRSFWVGAFVRADRLDGAAFESSPLVKRKSFVAGGVAFAWILGESSTRVPSDD